MNRNLAVDTVRLLAIVGVIVLHAQPFTVLAATSPSYQALFVVLYQSARFAVPFFFVIAGYYWGLKVRGGQAPLAVSTRAAGRLALLFVIWSLLYLLPHDPRTPELLEPARYLDYASSRLAALARNPVALLFEGTAIHLWFLPSLACAVLLSGALARSGRLLAIAASVLYLVGLAGGSYAASPAGIEMPGGFNTRNGPFFSLLPFAAGYYLSARAPTANWMRTGLGVFALGYVMHFGEIALLQALYQVRPVSHDYVLGTCLLGVGTAMVALSGHQFLQSAPLAAAGRLTLGVYCIHILFVKLLFPWFWPRTSPALEIVLVAAILALSLASCWLLSRIKHVRGLVA